jgi:hypothetical protein
MQTVSRFEANLLRLLYYFLRREPLERVLPLLEVRLPPPPCLAAGVVRLVRDALAKGTAFLLAQRGGWRREAHLRDGRAIEGRLWERTPPKELGLTFSEHSLRFLIWITANQPGDKDVLRLEPSELTTGDLLLLFFAHEGLRLVPELGPAALRLRPPFAGHGLCWLAYPEDFMGTPVELSPDFQPWMTGVGACIVEALLPVLAARWIAVEGSKELIIDPRQMQTLGESQERVLTAFLDAAQKAGRLDLVRFLLVAPRRLLGPHAHAGMWTGKLNLAGMRVADRAAAYQAAGALLRQMDRLQAWERQARSIGYFDEGYHASQLYKADWDRFEGDTLTTRAQAIVRQMDPLRQAGTEMPPQPSAAAPAQPRRV